MSIKGHDSGSTSTLGGEASYVFDHTTVSTMHAVVGADSDDCTFARKRR